MKQELVQKALDNLREKLLIRTRKIRENFNKAMGYDEFKKLYSEYSEMFMKVASGEIEEKTFFDKKQELDSYAKKIGIPEYEIEYKCKKCSDSGIAEDGSYCTCLKKEISKILIKNSGFTKLNDLSSSNFEIFSNGDEIKKIYDLMQKWCNKDSDKKLVYLLGNTGTGKTYLTSCMANEFIKQGKIVYMTTAFNLSQDFLKFHKNFDDRKKADIFDNYLKTEILFIDDLGTEPIYNNVSREYLYLLINERKIKNLRTIITSNLEPLDIREKYDERIFSRIMDKDSSIVLKLNSDDVRLKNKK